MRSAHSSDRFRLLVADRRGVMFEHPMLEAPGWDGHAFVRLSAGDFTCSDNGGLMVMLPGRLAVGVDPASGRFETVEFLRLGNRRIRCFAVAVILPPGYTRTLLPAYQASTKASTLPLFAYAAAAAHDGRFMAAGIRTDPHRHWDVRQYHTPDLTSRIRAFRSRFPRNRLLKQLARCSIEYRCCTAQNIFFRRWEGGLPVSPACNAHCHGCISLQDEHAIVPAQYRIPFVPTVDEITEIAVEHLSRARRPMISFGQGCEGEPTLQADAIAEAIRKIRRATRRGLIHMNSNGSRPEAVKQLAGAGLQSIRIALNSARPGAYRAYFQPHGYSPADVEASLAMARACKLVTSINLLVFPGVTDTPQEYDALARLLKKHRPDSLQLRNLCIDPDVYLGLFPRPRMRPMGIRAWLDRLRRDIPGLRIGNFNLLPDWTTMNR
ncbi:MAG: radical SAM protein [Lentisphaerae bacterium]|nr:radical SAM protein [Lentisphaerota bacterium]